MGARRSSPARDGRPPAPDARGGTDAARDHPRPAIGPELVLRLQSEAGNRGVSDLVASGRGAPGPVLAREPNVSYADPSDAAFYTVVGGDPAEGDGVYLDDERLVCAIPVMPADVAQRVIGARAVLSRIPRMTEADRKVLGTAAPGSQVVNLVERREALRTQLVSVQVEISSKLPPARLPDAEQAALEAVLGPLSLQAQDLQRQIEQTQKLIDTIAVALGFADEASLLTLVQDDFPKLFIRRAKEIAYRQLSDNAEVVEGESRRYGLGIPGQGAGSYADPASFGNPKDIAGLRAAAKQMLALDRQIALVKQTAEEEQMRALEEARRQQQEQQDADPDQDVDADVDGPIGVPIPPLDQETLDLAIPLQTEQEMLRLEFPILYRQDLDLTELSGASDTELARLTGAEAGEILSNIADTREAIEDGDLKIWSLRGVVELTTVDLGIPQDSSLLAVVQRHVQEEEADEALLKKAVSALAIVAGIVATFATGGLALAAGAVAFGAGGYQLAESVKRYGIETAANEVALDPQIADISVNDPEIMPIVMDLVGMAFSVGDLGRAIRALRGPAKTLAATGDIMAFATAARGVVPAAEVEAFVARAGRALGAEEATQTALRAIGDAFRHADMEEVSRLLAQSAEIGYRRMFDGLRGAGRVHPLDADTVGRYLGTAERLRVEGDPLLRALYDPGSRRLFIRDALSPETFGSWVVHELTHHIQELHGASSLTFRAEWQAYKMQQNFIHQLERAAGAQAVPAQMRWLSNMTDDALAAHITASYGYRAPQAYEMAEAMEELFAMIRRFEG